MTYGEFLRACRTRAGGETKSDFSRRLGLKDPDHYIGAENDTPGKRPSLDILERAARLAGFEFQECIVLPESGSSRPVPKHEKLHRQLQELLEREDEAADWIGGNISTFHRAYVVSARKRTRRRS
jgi:hypothetical protein